MKKFLSAFLSAALCFETLASGGWGGSSNQALDTTSTPQFARIGVGAAAHSTYVGNFVSTRNPTNGVIDNNLYSSWIPGTWPANSTACSIQGYIENNGTVSSATTHGIGTFGKFKDAPTSHLLGVGAEGFTDAYGDGAYYALVGHHVYTHATTNSASNSAAVYGLSQVTTDGTTALSSGVNNVFYAAPCVGGATKYSWHGFDSMRNAGNLYVYNSADTQYAYVAHDGSNATFGTGLGAILISPASGSGVLLGSGTAYFAPLVTGTCDMGAASFSWNDVYLDGTVKEVRNIATVSGGVPAEYATVDLTGQTAAISATTIYAVPAAGAGMYRVSWVATITTAATTSSVLGGANGFQVVYTDPADSVVKTTVAGNSITSIANTTATSICGSLPVYCKASTNLQYSMGYTSVGATPMAYNLHVKIEAL